MDRLRKDEIETIVGYLTDYVTKIILSRSSFATDAIPKMHESRDVLINHLMEKFGEVEKEEFEKPVYEGVRCPDCDGEMVSRKSQYGTFWGCKKYPKCRGTRDSEGRTKEEARIAKEKERVQPDPVDEHYRFRRS